MRRTIFAPVLLTLSSVAAPASADPIAITSGYVTAEVISVNARIVLSGENFALDAAAEAYGSSLSLACTPCAPGITVDLGGSFNGPRAAGSAVVDGVAYPEIFLDGMTGTFSSPAFQLSGAQAVTISRPFTFAGTVNGYLLNPWIHGLTEPAFSKTLVGRGIASATFLFNDDEIPLFTATRLRYDFTEAEPVPEPATLLLFGTGAAVVAVRRRRRNGAST